MSVPVTARFHVAASVKHRMRGIGPLHLEDTVDPVSLAAAAVPIVLAWLRKVGGGVVDDVVESTSAATAAKLKQIFQAIKDRFAGDAFAEQALDRVGEDTESAPRQRTLEDVLAERLEKDPDFARVLEGLIGELSPADRASVVAINTGIVAAGDVTQSGHNVAGRDLTINPKLRLLR
jgi:hypothetical protein